MPQCPDMWSNIIMDDAVGLFLDENNLYICELWGKHIILYNVDGPCSSKQSPKQNKMWTFPKQEGIQP